MRFYFPAVSEKLYSTGSSYLSIYLTVLIKNNIGYSNFSKRW